MGIDLKNPIIVGANNLVSNANNLKKMEDAGAAAIVFKSLFEEQLHLENFEIGEIMGAYGDRNAEMGAFYPEFDHGGPKEYISMLKKAKSTLSIPLFASLNAVYDESWVEYAKLIQETGVDGIELNFYSVPREGDGGLIDVIDWQTDILARIKKEVEIPIAVKLSPFYTNPFQIIRRLEDKGAEGFVLFNRFFQPDIDLEKEELYFPYNLSGENDYRLAMRFTGLLYDNIDASLCASGGVFTGYDAAKLILSGADSVQIVSTIYKNGIGQINLVINQLKSFMEEKGYKSIDDFKGKLSKKNVKDPFAYNRAQYIDILMNSKDIFKSYPMI